MTSPVVNTARGPSVPLTMTSDEFRRMGHELVDRIALHLASLPDHPVTRSESPGDVQSRIDARRPLPDTGTDASDLLRSAADLLMEHSLFNGHPRFFGYITSSPAPIGMLGDLLAAAVNANVGAWRLAPVATEIERQALRWIAELLGYPSDASGIFVSGGNMANIVGLLAARVRAADWDLRRTGLGGAAPRFRVYTSSETHTWIQKATDLAGLGTDAIRWIQTDADLRMDVRALRASLDRDREAGDRPLMVIGTAGTVSTGAVDPLPEIADVCEDAGVWFHVDGAYGALAAAVPVGPPALRALARADSLAVDPHKWLYAPLEAGCLLTRHPDALRNAFAYHPRYYNFGEEATNFFDSGPQNSRGFRALKVWLALQQAGRAGYERLIGDDIRLSERLFARVREHEELEAITQALSITTFRFVPADIRTRIGDAAVDRYLNVLNEALLDRLQRSGEAFVSNAIVHDRYVLRACIVNLNTRDSDIDALPGIVVRLGRDIDDERRARGERPQRTESET